MRASEREALFETISGQEVKPLYTEEDLRGRRSPSATSAIRASIPYTRGVYPSMYRGRLWTMRQFAGFGTAEETNERFHYLLDHGQTGLSTAFDMPTLMGLDSDARARWARSGWRASRSTPSTTWRRCSPGSTLGEVTTSMTINAPAAILLAFYVATPRSRASRWSSSAARSRPTSSRSTSPRRSGASRSSPAMRLVTDMIEWCAEHMPRWHPISISGYHIREAGSTAQQELAFTLKDGFTYVEQAIERGLDVDAFAPRLSLLLQRPHRLLRGDRQVPRRAADLGARDARDLRRQARGVAGGCASTPRPPASR